MTIVFTCLELDCTTPNGTYTTVLDVEGRSIWHLALCLIWDSPLSRPRYRNPASLNTDVTVSRIFTRYELPKAQNETLDYHNIDNDITV